MENINAEQVGSPTRRNREGYGMTVMYGKKNGFEPNVLIRAKVMMVMVMAAMMLVRDGDVMLGRD